MKTKIAILGSGNIGTDLLLKILKNDSLKVALFVGIDPNSEGLLRAKKKGIPITHKGIVGLLESEDFAEIKIVFDATSANAHFEHAKILKKKGKIVIDLTPAAVGPYVIPVANLDAHLDAENVNMVTCGGQATIPIIHAVNQAVPGDLIYGEIVASISSRSAGPGTRANIDEFTQTTARAIEVVGGAKKGKAIIVLNPSDPPLIMRDTVYTLVEASREDEEKLTTAIKEMVARVAAYVPGYRLTQDPVFDYFDVESPVKIPGYGSFSGVKITTLLEVEGAGDYLPKYAGNLDIMTAAALEMGVKIAQSRQLL